MNDNDINSHRWTQNLPNPASPQMMRAWQDKLNTVCGVEPDGTPRLRLVWLPDGRTQETWDRYRGDWSLKYVWNYVREQTDGDTLSAVRFIPIAPPRFAIEALVPATAIRKPKGWDAAGVDTEWFLDEDGKMKQIITDVYHENRNTGPEYARIAILMQHSTMRHPHSKKRMCCHQRWVEDGERECLGMYRPFDDGDVEAMKRNYQAKIEQAKKFRPDQPLTQEFRAHVFQRWAVELHAERERQREAMEMEQEKQIADLVKTFSNLALPGAVKNRFSIPETV